LKQLSQKEVKPLREQLLKKNNYHCPICNQPLTPENAALDHDHDNGQIRGTICKFCNSLEGIWRSRWKRSGLMEKISYRELLENMCEYLKQEPLPYLHPSHKPKPRKLQKRSYQELVRVVEKYNKNASRKRKVPPYPKSKRLTKRLKEMFNEFGIQPRYYK